MGIANAPIRAVGTSSKEGIPQIQEEDQLRLDRMDTRTVGPSEHISADGRVSFSTRRQKGDTRKTYALLSNAQWELPDYGDIPHWGKVPKALIGDLNPTGREENKWLITHLATGPRSDQLNGEDVRMIGGRIAIDIQIISQRPIRYVPSGLTMIRPHRGIREGGNNSESRPASPRPRYA